MNNKDFEDVDDDLFISKKRQDYIFEKKINETEERLANTLNILQESEHIGQSTLEDLATQRETLERVENDLDSINTMTRVTAKHLNNMRSFFGGIKSFFGGNSSASSSQAAIGSTRSAIPKSRTLANVPSNIPAGSSNSNPRPSVASSSSRYGSGAAPIDKPQDAFEANLSELGFGLGRLKEMAMKIGDEIGDQNDMLDRITDKSERAGDSVKNQNRQIQNLLKK